MQPLHRFTRVTGDLVVRQPVHAQRALGGRLQVAELAVQPGTASCAQARRQRGVAVGRDVPVPGHRQHQAAAVVDVDRRRQPARLARVAQGEAQRRQRQDGRAQEAQHGAFGNAFIGIQVDGHAVGAQHPGRLGAGAAAARATGVAGVDGARAGIAEKVDAVGTATGPQRQELELGLQEKALEALHRDFQPRPAVLGAVAVHAHMAGGAGQVARRVVGQAVGADDQAAAAELDHAFGYRFQVGLAADALCLQHDGQLARSLGARQRHEAGAGFQGGGRSGRGRRQCRGRLTAGAAAADPQRGGQSQQGDSHAVRVSVRRGAPRRVRRIDYP